MKNPKFIISKKKVLKQYAFLKGLYDVVSYSSKTNPLITKILEEDTDSMFSIHFINELENIKDRSRILFFAQAWNKNDIKNLIAGGIRWFVVDNEADLKELEEFLKHNDCSINLLLRIRLMENTLKTGRYFVFGMDSDFINNKVGELRKNKKICKLGVHFHKKTQNMSEWNLKYEFNNVINNNIIDLIDIVNIGGGLPSDYADTNINVLNSIFTRINEFRSFLKEKNIKMMIEPGRFIAAPSGRLVVSIISIYRNNIIINASVYQGDMDALIIPVKLKVDKELPAERGKPYVIKGMTPCSMDIFRYKVYLKNPKVGKELTFLNAGAYNFSTNFCNLDIIETEIIEDFK